jgi:UMF1 family MFS transporter
MQRWDDATTRSFAALSYVSVVLYMGAIVGATAGMGYMDEEENKGTLEDEIATARLSQSVSFTVCVIGLGTAWGILFQRRPAMQHVLPEGQSLWTAGFRQVRKTVVEIHNKHLRLKWFYISIMFCDPAIMALTILSITFLTDQLQFTAKENGTAILIMMLAAVPGSYIGSWATTKFNAVISSLVAIALLIANTVVVSIVLKGPGQEMETYILAGGWGLGTGWKWMCDRMVLLLVLPPGQNAELMGVYIFFRQVIAWLPPLVFTILNENDISQRIGIATLNAYFLLAFLALWRVLVASKPAVVGEAQANPSTSLEDTHVSSSVEKDCRSETEKLHDEGDQNNLDEIPL